MRVGFSLILNDSLVIKFNNDINVNIDIIIQALHSYLRNYVDRS